jgi:hypothetical protein
MAVATLAFVCSVFTIDRVMDETHFRAYYIGSGRREHGMMDARFKRAGERAGGCDSIKSGGCCVCLFFAGLRTEPSMCQERAR